MDTTLEEVDRPACCDPEVGVQGAVQFLYMDWRLQETIKRRGVLLHQCLDVLMDRLEKGLPVSDSDLLDAMGLGSHHENEKIPALLRHHTALWEALMSYRRVMADKYESEVLRRIERKGEKSRRSYPAKKPEEYLTEARIINAATAIYERGDTVRRGSLARELGIKKNNRSSLDSYLSRRPELYKEIGYQQYGRDSEEEKLGQVRKPQG